MTRHSKNSTAGAYFTSAEKSKLDYGSQKQRLGRDSFRTPDTCYICFKVAVDPVLCLEGHLFCRECILTSIVNQKQKILRQQKEYEEILAKRKTDEVSRQDKEQQRRVAEFEAVQHGKRFKPDEQSVKKDLPAFWVPSKTPQASFDAGPPKKETACPAGDHVITSKKLVSISWSKNERGRCVCRICGKELALVTGILSFRPCGHVICTKCSEQVEEESCLVCGQGTEGKVKLVSEGTGFACSGGIIELKKVAPAFV